MRVSKLVLHKLSGMLNEAKPLMLEAVTHSQLQLSYIRRAAKDQAVEMSSTINCYRVRFSMPHLTSKGGVDFQVAFEGRIPTGELLGLCAASTVHGR